MNRKALKLTFMVVVLSLISGLFAKLWFSREVNWALLLTVGIALVIGVVLWRFEWGRVNSRQMAVVATMSALAAISRVPFAAIMGLQPTTFVVMITGYVFGPQMGFVVGAVAALVSNFFLGQGPWTPWQMFCWGVCGVIAGALARYQKGFNSAIFAVVGGVCGYLFGWVMDFWYWVGFVYPLTWKTFVAAYAASLPADTLHAIGNVVFAMVFGKPFYSILYRFKTRFSVDYIE